MKTLIEPFLTIQFLIGTVVAGILINFISHLLNPKLSGWFAMFSTKWATRTEKLKGERENRINSLIDKPRDQIHKMLQASYIRSMGHQYYLMLIVCLCIDTIVVGIRLNADPHNLPPINIAINVFVFLQYILVILASAHIIEANSIMKEVNEAKTRTNPIPPLGKTN